MYTLLTCTGNLKGGNKHLGHVYLGNAKKSRAVDVVRQAPLYVPFHGMHVRNGSRITGIYLCQIGTIRIAHRASTQYPSGQ